jgi:hypothetical protein
MSHISGDYFKNGEWYDLPIGQLARKIFPFRLFMLIKPCKCFKSFTQASSKLNAGFHGGFQ